MPKNGLQRTFSTMHKKHSPKIYNKFIDHCFQIDSTLTVYKLLHMDINGTKDEVYAIGCSKIKNQKYHQNQKIIRKKNKTNGKSKIENWKNKCHWQNVFSI